METIFILHEKDAPTQIPVTLEEEKAIDRALGLNKYVVRLEDEINEQLLQAAQKEGLIPQAYLRKLIEEHFSKVV